MTNTVENCSASEKRLSAYYAGAGIVPLGTIGYPAGLATAIPSNGTIALSNFYGSAFRQFSIPNGSFEILDNLVETDAETKMTGWTVYKRRTRMNGFDTILNFPTPVDPTPAYESSPVPYGDDVQLSTIKSPNPFYSVRFIDTSATENWHLQSPATVGKYILELTIIATLDGPYSLANPNNHGIVRGPILVNNRAFNFNLGDRIEFLWRAEKNEPIGDKYDVLVYLLEIYSGRTIVLLDAKGVTVAWQRVRYILSDAGFQGIYKIVFVGGSYDSSGGLSVGSKFYLDEVKIEKVGTFSPFNGLYEPLLGPTSNIANTAKFTLNSFTQFTIVNAPPQAEYSLTVTTPGGALPVQTGRVDHNGLRIFPTTNLNQIGNYNFSLVFNSNISQIVSGKVNQVLSISVSSNLEPDPITNPQGFTYILTPEPTQVMEESVIKYTFRTNDNVDGVYQANVAIDSTQYIESNSQPFILSAAQGIRSPKFVGNGFFEHSFFLLARAVNPGVFQANLTITKDNVPVTISSGGTIKVYDISELPVDTPVIASVTPTTGTNGQQTTVSLTGSGFIHSQIGAMSTAQKRNVTIGSVLIFQTQTLNNQRVISTVPGQAFNIEVTSSNNMTFKMPLLPINGSYDIQLLNQNGAPIGLIKKNAFSITGTTPVITRRSPSRIAEFGGTRLTIYGWGLSGTTAVSIGGLPCTNIINVSDTEISCITPRYVRKSNALQELSISESYGQDGVVFYTAGIMVTTGLGSTSSLTTSSLNIVPATVDYYFARSPFITKGIENLSINGGTVTYDGLTDLPTTTTANLVIDGQEYLCTSITVPQNDKITFNYPAVPAALRNVDSVEKLLTSKIKFTTNVNFAPANYPNKQFTVIIPVNFYYDVLPISYTITRNSSGAITLPGQVVVSLAITGIPLDSSGTTRVQYRVYGGPTLSLSTIIPADLGLTALEGTFDFSKSSVNFVQTSTVTLNIANSIRSKASLVTFELVGIPNKVLAIPLVV